MIALLAAERVKLVSTRSPWWCATLAVGLVVGLTVLLTATATAGIDVAGAAAGLLPFGMVIAAVMATVAVTAEFRFSTIRTTFAAAPGRTSALLAKTIVVAVAAGLIGLVAAAASWAVVWALSPGLAPAGADAWRVVLGAGPVFALAAVLAVALGILVRHTAGALTVLLVWALLAESLVALIPSVGPRIQGWLPFVNLGNVLLPQPGMPFGPWGSLVYVAALTVGLMTLALLVAQLRDA